VASFARLGFGSMPAVSRVRLHSSSSLMCCFGVQQLYGILCSGWDGVEGAESAVAVLGFLAPSCMSFRAVGMALMCLIPCIMARSSGACRTKCSELQNKEFQATVVDQRETQKLLRAALGMLQDFYGKKAASLVQRQEPVGPPPPPGFEAYKNNAASGGVMSMIEQIISDAKAMEAEAIRSEEDSQKAYEDFVKETNNSIEAKSRDIVNKSEEKAKAETDLVDAKKAKDAVMLELEQLSNYDAELHQSCDFVLNNFVLRQTARDEEVEALRQAKAILSGAKFEACLQGA